MREFAEQEIVLPPTGPYRNLKFRCDRQPYAGLFFDEIDRGGWGVINATGPSQSGKTLTCTIIPLLYHLFERQETVIFGLPDKDMANDKWTKDILPVLMRTRYRELLPERGEGSRGGKVVDSIEFRNGATLKFMSAGGDDKERSHFTARVLVITELNAFGKSGESSEESTKYEQLRARVLAFDDQAIIYQECTETIETGLVHVHYQLGTASRIVSPCPHCGHFVAPDREQLIGWQDAIDEYTARERAVFICPREECGHIITDDERRQMLSQARLVHRDQEILPDGTIVGDAPRTSTLGFRWGGFDNLLRKTGSLAVEEWKGARDPNKEAAERKLCQFQWGRPYKSDSEEAVLLRANEITARLGKWSRGVVPRETIALTTGIDLHKRFGQWMTIAWLHQFGGHIVDYGDFPIAGDRFGPDQAIESALRTEQKGFLSTGWVVEDTGRQRCADLHLIDIGYFQDAVFRFLHSLPDELRPHYRAAKCYGAGKFRAERYTKPKSKSNTVLAIGEMFHLADYASDGVVVFEMSADYWKSFFHNRLATALVNNAGTPGAISLFSASPRVHDELADHLTAERKFYEFVEGDGYIERWERVRRKNHLLDCASMATAGANWCGLRFTPPAPPPREEPVELLTLPDGRPFCVLDR